jgi:ATP-dependent exoDNAse (exonuclease V) beta subunit
VRREDLISRDAAPSDVAADRARYDAWREKRQRAVAAGEMASLMVSTATELTKREGAVATATAQDVAIETAVHSVEPRPSGKRFGILVHAVLASLPLDAADEEVKDLAALHAKLFAASEEERNAAAAIASSLVKHPRWQAARAASAAGRRVWREAPVVLRLDARDSATHVMDGQVDLAYETDTGWVVVDFKTDIEIAAAQDTYRQQVAFYVDAVARATGQPATGVLLRV